MAGQYDAFDQDDNVTYAKPEKAIWEYDVFDKTQWGDVAKWLQGEKNYLLEENRERFRRIENNLALYRGIQYHSQQMREDIRDISVDRSQSMTKIVSNHIYDLTQNKVSRLIKYKPGIAVLPTSNELEDKVGAKMSKTLIDHVWYMQEFEGDITPDFIKLTHVMGECYLATLWDKNSGAVVEEFKPEDIKAIEEKGFLTIQDEDGKDIKIDRVIKYGDTVYKIWYTLDILLQRKQQYREVEYMYHKEYINTQLAKKMYPGISIENAGEQDAYVYDFEKMQSRRLKDHTLKWTFFHKKTEQMPKGCEIEFIGSKIVAVRPLGCSSGELPVERLTDIDLPGQLHGVSFIEMIKGLTGTYNNLTNLVVRNQVMCAHPKWVFPAGSVKKESLGNDITLVEFKGPQPPVLAQQNPTPAEIFSFRDSLKEEFQQIAGIFGVSRGEPPPGVKSGVALQFLSEQENERFNEMVLKFSQWTRRVAIRTLERCADNYKPDDKRMLMVMGRNNKWMTTFFDVKYLARKYDIRVQNSSALPQSKAARTQYLLDLNEQFPGQVTPEQVLDMLDLAQPDKFLDYNTVSVRAAEAENESIIEGTFEIIDPKEYEDHLQHWTIHTKQMREWSFKNQTEPRIQQQMEAHVTATEMLMTENAMKNPAYLEKCMALPGWPIFFQMPQPPPPPLPPMPDQGALPPPPEEQQPQGSYQDQPEPTNVPPPAITQQQDLENALPPNPGPIEPTNAS